MTLLQSSAARGRGVKSNHTRTSFRRTSEVLVAQLAGPARRSMAGMHWCTRLHVYTITDHVVYMFTKLNDNDKKELHYKLSS